MVDFRAVPAREKMTIPAWSFWVPMKQRRARLILAMLEPQAPDSLARWGFCNTVLERRGGAGDYSIEPVARGMMADSPELRKQFEERLAANPRARLMWWYQQSNYNAGDTGRYPAVRVWEKAR